MSVTAKEIAKKMGISTASVSVALNNKPGVSTATRKQILEVAREMGYDFSSVTKTGKISGSIYYVRYINYNSPTEAPFFGYLAESLEKTVTSKGYKYKSLKIYGDDSFHEKLDEIRFSDCAGLLLLGTDITRDKLLEFLSLNIPLVLMDTWFNSPSINCVKVNNIQGGYLATEYLIKKYGCQPGYLKSSLKLFNYDERYLGYCKALETYRMSVINSEIFTTLPNRNGSEADMHEILTHRKDFARCFVADTDAQAVGAMSAFQAHGYKVPEDVAFVGFDNSSHSENSHPGLTTIDAYPTGMAQVSVQRLLDIITGRLDTPIKIEIGTSLVERGSA